MPRTGTPLGRVRILLVEDSELDAELLVEQLQEAGLDAEFQRVDDAASMTAAEVASAVPTEALMHSL